MSRGMSKAERLKEMERLYVQRAFTDIEMAQRLGVVRSTVYKDRQLLEREIPFQQDANGRWYIDKAQYLSAIRVNLYEALSLYLAARRASRQTQMAQPHVASGLEKLAAVLKQPMTERLVKAADRVLTQRNEPDKVKIMETLARGWAEQIKVRIWYQALEATRVKVHLVAPYLIEPSHWSDSTYLIAHSHLNDDVIPFKIERIERATLTTEPFTLPEEFDEETLLRHAWGIWYAKRQPERVKLRFAPGRATRRIKESQWHPTEKVTGTEDGGCIWQAQVDEWQEMLPWIRGWGAECEVLEPVELRETLMGEAKAMAEQYGWFVSSHTTHQDSVVDDFFGE